MNSKFTNRLPRAKYTEYGADEKARQLSLKLQEMYNVVEQNKGKARAMEWFETEIKQAERKALERFERFLS